MSIIADVASIGSALFIVGFAVWMTMQLLKSAD
jgi:hypothetical protein